MERNDIENVAAGSPPAMSWGWVDQLRNNKYDTAAMADPDRHYGLIQDLKERFKRGHGWAEQFDGDELMKAALDRPPWERDSRDIGQSKLDFLVSSYGRGRDLPVHRRKERETLDREDAERVSAYFSDDAVANRSAEVKKFFGEAMPVTEMGYPDFDEAAKMVHERRAGFSGNGYELMETPDRRREFLADSAARAAERELDRERRDSESAAAAARWDAHRRSVDDMGKRLLENERRKFGPGGDPAKYGRRDDQGLRTLLYDVPKTAVEAAATAADAVMHENPVGRFAFEGVGGFLGNLVADSVINGVAIPAAAMDDTPDKKGFGYQLANAVNDAKKFNFLYGEGRLSKWGRDRVAKRYGVTREEWEAFDPTAIPEYEDSGDLLSRNDLSAKEYGKSVLNGLVSIPAMAVGLADEALYGWTEESRTSEDKPGLNTVTDWISTALDAYDVDESHRGSTLADQISTAGFMGPGAVVGGAKKVGGMRGRRPGRRADLGGESRFNGAARELYAGDDVPESIFGIPVVSNRADYTEEDLSFFRENPEAGGYYSLGTEEELAEERRDADAQDRAAENGGEVRKPATRFVQPMHARSWLQKEMYSAMGLNEWGGNLKVGGRPWYLFRDDKGKINAYGTTMSTVLPEDNGAFTVIPTIVDGKLLSEDQAVDTYRKTGKFWGKMDSMEGARRLADTVHQREMRSEMKKWNEFLHENWGDVSDEITNDPGMAEAHREWVSKRSASD